MGTKAERRAARDRVSAYHQAQLAELLSHVGAEIDRYRVAEIDAYAADETIHHYSHAAAELWKFCFARGGGAHAEFIAGLIDRMTSCPVNRSVSRQAPSRKIRCSVWPSLRALRVCGQVQAPAVACMRRDG